MEQLFNLTIKPIFITLEVAAFWFLLTGLQERYFKPWAIGFWGGVERRVLGLVFERLDPKMPGLMAALPTLSAPEYQLKERVYLAIIEAAEEIGAELSESQMDRILDKFGELYNPFVNAGKLQ